MWSQRRPSPDGLLNPDKFVNKFLLIVDLNKIGDTICPQQLYALIFLPTEKEISTKKRHQRF
jgi:hypothetical protein